MQKHVCRLFPFCPRAVAGRTAVPALPSFGPHRRRAGGGGLRHRTRPEGRSQEGARQEATGQAWRRQEAARPEKSNKAREDARKQGTVPRKGEATLITVEPRIQDSPLLPKGIIVSFSRARRPVRCCRLGYPRDLWRWSSQALSPSCRGLRSVALHPLI